MKTEHKALLSAIALAALVPACYIVSEKPADSAPPVAAAGAAAVTTATAVATVAPTVPPLTTTPATTSAVPPRPPSLTAAKPLPTVAAGGATGTP